MQFFSYDTFHFSARQRIEKLILHQILYVYPHIGFINKEMSIFQKLCVRCDSLKLILFGINRN